MIEIYSDNLIKDGKYLLPALPAPVLPSSVTSEEKVRVARPRSAPRTDSEVLMLPGRAVGLDYVQLSPRGAFISA